MADPRIRVQETYRVLDSLFEGLRPRIRTAEEAAKLNALYGRAHRVFEASFDVIFDRNDPRAADSLARLGQANEALLRGTLKLPEDLGRVFELIEDAISKCEQAMRSGGGEVH